MTLAEYRSAVTDLESQPPSEAVQVWAVILAGQLRRALWRTGLREEAASLAERCDAVYAAAEMACC